MYLLKVHGGKPVHGRETISKFTFFCSTTAPTNYLKASKRIGISGILGISLIYKLLIYKLIYGHNKFSSV